MNARVGATAKALEERGIFECFAQAAGLVVCPESITQPDPPDVLCEIEGLGHVGFELVQLDDPGELQRMKYLDRGPEFWEGALGEIPRDVVERHRSAQINVVFDAKANKARRRDALERIAAALCKMPEGAEGAFLAKMPEGLKSAELRLFPSITHGPVICEVSSSVVKFEPGRVAPVGIDLERIQSKIDHYAKGWGTRAELLAYARWGMPFSDQAHEAELFLATRFPSGIFQRGWIYELTSRRVVACAP
ncbi:MAG: hypothetical protein EKK47_06865 [Burkholderiales bacterium]|jgi:hypothetical protein|nr:MAG: hypothetical protein EKK47_06865 [Burkholderiales bacterium]